MFKKENSINKKAWFQISEKSKEWLIFSICLICIFLFLYTANSKLQDHTRFLKGLSRVQVIGSFARYISWAVPVAEIAIAILMVIPQTCKWGLYGFTILMSIFTFYIISMVLWATELPCHCGGAIEKLTWTQHIWFNLAFISLSIFALLLSKLNLKN
jgi:hypothetical protein